MIADSSLFNNLIKGHTELNKANSIIAGISTYEKDFQSRKALHKIKREDYIEVLNSSIDYIEKCGRIVSWVNQLKLNIMHKKELLNKKYDIEKIKISKQIEVSEALREITTKEEKKQTKIFMLKEQLLELEQEMDTIKLELSIGERFVNDADGLNKLAYAYFQAVKQIAE